MATRLEIAQLLADDRATEPGSVVLSQDRARSLSSSFVRAIRNGRPTMGVGSDIGTSAAAAALVHLVSWQLPIDNLSNGVTLLLDESRAEVVDGARTLRSSLPPSLQGAVQIAVLKDGREQTVDVAEGAPDFTHSKGAERWKLLLDKWRVANPPSLAQLLMEKVDSPSVRLYPMLSGNPRTGHWSMRIDGLEVGRVSSSKSYLDVGHTSAAGHVSPARGKWLGVNPSGRFAFDESTVDSAARLLQSLITSFESSDGALDHGQPEHALESRVLRGLVPVRTGGSTLDVWLEDGLVSRGSQFPTLWTERGRPKYLDALLRHGSTPWAVELKVLKSGGSGSYYRHGLAQAVLYRHFIQSAVPLHPWFAEQGVVPVECRAAVAFPKFTGTNEAYEARVALLRELGSLFNVEVIELEA